MTRQEIERYIENSRALSSGGGCLFTPDIPPLDKMLADTVIGQMNISDRCEGNIIDISKEIEELQIKRGQTIKQLADSRNAVERLLSIWDK